MSTPLPEQTPSGEGTSASAQPPARPRPGCWRLGGITCGVLFCIFGVLLVSLFITMRPLVRRVFVQERELLECRPHIEGDSGLQGALQRYRSQKGEYPLRLLDLYPRFVSKKAIFHCPADPAPRDAVSYGYRRPAPDAPKETIVLICDHHIFPGSRMRWEVPIEGNARLIQEPMPDSEPER